MRVAWILAAGILLGFAIGFAARDATLDPRPTPSSVENATSRREPPAGDDAERSDRLELARRARNRGDDHEPDRDRHERREERTRSEALAAFRDALASGDRGALHEALRDLSRPDGEPLGAEELEELGSLLQAVDESLVEELSHALVVSGGAAGVALVMGFVEDTEVSLEARERALHGLFRVPPEMAETVAPALAEFLENGPPFRLEHTAARAFGHLFREGGTEALLGLLADRPGIRPDVIFDAIGDTGRTGDAGTLLDMLSGDWSVREKRSLLRSIGRLSARQEDGTLLLDMMRNPPDGVSRSMLADAIGDASHHLGAATLREALLETAGDRRAQERLAQALLETGGRAGLDTLLDLAADPEFDLDGRALAHALDRFGDPDAVPLMTEMLRRSQDHDSAEALARGMLRSGNRKTLDQLMDILETGTESQRRAIAHSLGDEGKHAAVDFDRLVSALRRERNVEVGSSLARSLSRGFGERGFQEVVDLLQGSPDAEQRHALLWGLEESLRRDQPRSRELFLSVAQNDPAPEVRRHAVEIIQHQRDASMVPALEEILRRETNAGVQKRLRDAIRELEQRR